MTSTGRAVLRLTCPDQRGIVARVAGYLAAGDANIIHAEQHTDNQTGLFFQRIDFDVEDSASHDRLAELERGFKTVTEDLEGKCSFDSVPSQASVAILCSKQGHCLHDLLSRWQLGEMPGQLRLVASNHPDHRDTVEQRGIPFHYLPVDPSDQKAQQEALTHLLVEADIDLVVMARYMQILPDFIVDSFRERIINIHHSFLPAFPGGRPYHQAHARGVKLIGATAHYATVDLDEGPIIEQETTPVTHRFSPEALVQRGRDLEMLVLSRAVRAHLEHRVIVHGNRTIVFS